MTIYLGNFKWVFPQLQNLVKLKHLDHDKCNIIRIHGAFATQGIYHMVFEHLDRSLADLLEAQPFNRLQPNHIRLIVWQVITTILHLLTITVIETH